MKESVDGLLKAAEELGSELVRAQENRALASAYRPYSPCAVSTVGRGWFDCLMLRPEGGHGAAAVARLRRVTSVKC